MWVAVMIAMQAGAVAGPVLPVPRRPEAPTRCPVGETGDDVVVCARSAEEDRLRPVPDYSKPLSLPKARTEIPGVGTLSGEVEQAGVGGFPSNRAMIRLKIPLGGRRRP
ncbi:5'-nucleotidase [Sphingomonas sp.]|uniref:5'-nucleotidase n=1 Tax=Sphingomonas sp. TaxID=28214 RepID=UPI0031D36331